MKKIYLAASLIFMIIFLCISAVQAQSPQATLNQYIADLQKNPNDYALREKIIKHVQTMRPKPVVPDEASKYMDRGIAAFEGAKGEEDFRAASAEFSKAVNLAPWLGDAYRNLAIAQDKSGQYDVALKNLRLYLLTSPSPADEAWAKSLINKIEYRKEKAAKESSPQAIAAKQQNQTEEFFRRIVGARYIWHVNWVDYEETFSVDIYGEKVIFGTTPTRVSRGGVLPSNLSLGVYTELWPCSITKKTMQGGDLVIEVGGCWGMQGYTVRNNGGSLTLISTHYKRGYWQNAVFTRSR